MIMTRCLIVQRIRYRDTYLKLHGLNNKKNEDTRESKYIYNVYT